MDRNKFWRAVLYLLGLFVAAFFGVFAFFPVILMTGYAIFGVIFLGFFILIQYPIFRLFVDKRFKDHRCQDELIGDSKKEKKKGAEPFS